MNIFVDELHLVKEALKEKDFRNTELQSKLNAYEGEFCDSSKSEFATEKDID